MGWINCAERSPEPGFFPVIRKVPEMELFLDYASFDGDNWAEDPYWYEFTDIPVEQ